MTTIAHTVASMIGSDRPDQWDRDGILETVIEACASAGQTHETVRMNANVLGDLDVTFTDGSRLLSAYRDGRFDPFPSPASC